MRFNKFKNLFLEAGGKEVEHFAVFDQNYQNLSKSTDRIISLLQNQKIAKAESLYFTKYDSYFNTMRTAMDKLTELSLKDAENEYNRHLDTASAILVQSLIVIAFIAIFLIIMAFFLTRSITSPIQTVIHILDRFSQGDLTMEVEVTGKDESAKMLNAMKVMAQSLKNIVRDILESSDLVASASSEIGATAQSLTDSTNEQAANVEEISSSLEEIASAVSQNTDKSRDTNNLAKKTSEKAE